MESANSNPLITVIVPVYNTEPYLRKCLDSVCGQTYRNLEIICVNDGSTDGSQAILEEYAARDARVKVLVQENAGLAAARNRALEIATGEWISCIDSDDWIDADTYEKLLNATPPDVNIVCFDALVEGGGDNEKTHAVADFYTAKFDGTHEISERHLLNTNTSVATKLIRLECVRKHELRFPDGKRYEDAVFIYRLMMVAGKITYVKGKGFYHYFQRTGSIMQATFNKNPYAVDNLENCEYVRDFCEKYGLLGKWENAFAMIFHNAYYFSSHFIPDDMKPQLQQKAYLLARKWNLLRRRDLTSIQEIRQNNLSRLEKVFHTCHRNRDSYGLGGISLLSIVHTGGQDTYYLCGKKLFSCKAHY